MSWQSLLHDDPVPWLLEKGDPAVRALTLRQVLDRGPLAPDHHLDRRRARVSDPHGHRAARPVRRPPPVEHDPGRPQPQPQHRVLAERREPARHPHLLGPVGELADLAVQRQVDRLRPGKRATDPAGLAKRLDGIAGFTGPWLGGRVHHPRH